MEIVHQNGLMMGHAIFFRQVPCGYSSNTFTIKEFAKVDPYVQKFCIPLLSKTLVSKIDLKQDPLSMDPE